MKIIIFFCSISDLNRERLGYFEAFSNLGYVVKFVSNDRELTSIKLFEGEILFGLHLDACFFYSTTFKLLSFPIGCLHIDTNDSLKKRIVISSLFDFTIVLHPSYKKKFLEGSIQNILELTHVIQENAILLPTSNNRKYDIAWVGRLDGPNFKVRRRILKKLSSDFYMNDPYIFYHPEQMFEIYNSSKIILNISKDDYMIDSNIRCFEAMACGVPLLTPENSELGFQGFIEGENYWTFNTSSYINLKAVINMLLKEHDLLLDKALLTKELVLRNFTYKNNAEKILNFVFNNLNGKDIKFKDNNLYLHNVVIFYLYAFNLNAAFEIFKTINWYSIYKPISFYRLLKCFLAIKYNSLRFGQTLMLCLCLL